jgi:hypothetical protein
MIESNSKVINKTFPDDVLFEKLPSKIPKEKINLSRDI